MFLKDHLKEVFYKASLENNKFVKENILKKWVHRFGFDSLNDLLLQNPNLKDQDYEKENEVTQEQMLQRKEDRQNEEENQEQISLIEEYKEDRQNEEENQEQISLIEEYKEERQKLNKAISIENLDIAEEINCKSDNFESTDFNEIISKKESTGENTKNYNISQNLPLPYIKNLRKWINKDNKAS